MEETSRQTFAESLEMSATGGGFGYLVGSLAMYGLVETGSGSIRYTDLARTILHGEPDEVAVAKSQAARNISLFAEIFDRFGSNFNEDQVRLFLREKAGVDIADANALAVDVIKLMKRDATFLKPVETAAHPDMGASVAKVGMPLNAEEVSSGLADDVIATLRSRDFGVLTIKDEVGADIAIRMIEAIKQRINSERNTQHEEGKE